MKNVQYVTDPVRGSIVAIRYEIEGRVFCAPLDPANTDYQNIMRLVAEGKLTIAPAE